MFRMFRSSSQSRNKLSLNHLKYLYTVLEKNTTVSENNRGLLVESLRSIAEILIWGDQNDSSVFDFFLEKNMLSYFLHIMRQKSGGPSFVCVQLLQTLNILFENIRNETSLYYLLSNNHVNSIIVHKFDFSDEDVMGYYILFLKTLSLKLNPHTIHFFYNEHTHDFPLYTEAIKFFNHPESMVRIAVRTISLNVYRVQNTSMLEFIRDRTAAPYFSNLVWFIGKHILELDACLQNDSDANHQSQHKLENLVAEHLDHLHYLNDILLLRIDDLNAVLTEHLLHKLFVPLYIFSLTPTAPLAPMARVTRDLAAVLNKVVDIETNNPRVAPIIAKYLLSLVFLVVTHGPLVHSLAWVIFNGNYAVFKEGVSKVLNHKDSYSTIAFAEPIESLEEALENTVLCASSAQSSTDVDAGGSSSSATAELGHTNKTDEEKIKCAETGTKEEEIMASSDRPFLDICLSALDCTENDYLPLLALCLIYAMSNNKGIDEDWLENVLQTQRNNNTSYKTYLVDKLLNVIAASSQLSYRIRLVTLDLCILILIRFIKHPKYPYVLSEAQHSIITQAQGQCVAALRSFYLSEEIFLDLFEDEYNEVKKNKLNVEFLCMDSTILLPPTVTPMTGIHFTRRLPCGDVEKARRAIRTYLYLRNFCNRITDAEEKLLPLTKDDQLVQIDNVLDLNNSDLIACTVIMKDNTKYRRFLVIDILQLILVEPDSKRLGWGVAKLVGLLQDVEVIGDKDDSRCLHLTIHRGGGSANRTPILSAKFVFDDHIRCMAAKQRLTKGRTKARQKKMLKLAQLLEIQDAPIQDPSMRFSPLAAGGSGSALLGHREHRPLFSVAHRVPGVASAFSPSAGGLSRVQMASNRPIIDGSTIKHPATPTLRTGNESPGERGSRPTSGSSRSGSPRTTKMRSREGSPQVLPTQRSAEDIPLENLSRSSTPVLGLGSSAVGVGKPMPIPVLVNSSIQLRNSPRKHHSLDGGISVSSSPASERGGGGGLLGGSPLNSVVVTTPKKEVSQETSFMGGPESEEPSRSQEKEKRKGAIETV